MNEHREYWVVTHTDDLGWEPWLWRHLQRCLNRVGNTFTVNCIYMHQRPLTQSHLSYEVRYWQPHQFTPYLTGHGYFDQQQLKLQVFKHSSCDQVIIIDTKCLAWQPEADHTIELREPDRWQRCADHYRSRWGLAAQPTRWRMGPSLWHTETLESLWRELGQDLGVRSAVDQTYAATGKPLSCDQGLFSEFTVYDLWLQAQGQTIPTGADCVEDIMALDQQPTKAWISVHRRELTQWFGRDHAKAEQWMLSLLSPKGSRIF